MGIETTRLNISQQAGIDRIVRKIDAALDGENKSLAMSALTFTMLAIIQVERKMSQREAIRYAIYHLKNYTHMIEYT